MDQAQELDQRDWEEEQWHERAVTVVDSNAREKHPVSRGSAAAVEYTSAALVIGVCTGLRAEAFAPQNQKAPCPHDMDIERWNVQVRRYVSEADEKYNSGVGSALSALKRTQQPDAENLVAEQVRIDDVLRLCTAADSCSLESVSVVSETDLALPRLLSVLHRSAPFLLIVFDEGRQELVGVPMRCCVDVSIACPRRVSPYQQLCTPGTQAVWSNSGAQGL